MRHGRNDRRVRGFATVFVVVAIAIATLVLLSLQSTALRQASAGREALARVRAEWAARAGVEATIAVLEFQTQQGGSVTAWDLFAAMDEVSAGTLDGAEYDIRHTDDRGNERPGVMDAHSRLNVNRMQFDDLMLLPGMTEDVADAILDWIDPDDVPREFGAEAGYYLALPSPYEPRNGPMRTLAELELVRGVRPEQVRGEDWNMNSRLDPNEDDGDLSWPPDSANGILDQGWGAYLTAASIDQSPTPTGQERLYLLDASEAQLVNRITGINPLQARVILDFASQDNARLEDLIARPLPNLASSVPNLGAPAQSVPALTEDQIRKILEECTLHDPNGPPVPGRLNINTVGMETLQYIAGLPVGFADQLVFARNTRPEGFTSVLDLLDIMGPVQVAQYSRLFAVESNTFVVSARGRDVSTGIEVDVVAVIARPRLPVVIYDCTVR
ncbi:MAG: hypothetical protein EA380_03130 [Phycisphaeraceae bacterium]|nr:MAG: hypothetical protein EA380_03130 [Phycisphaeraceae bacterium]